MTSEPAGRTLLVLGEVAPTAATRLRVMLDDLVDLVLPSQLATNAGMPVLGARLASSAVAGQQILGFRASLRAALLTRRGRILRRRLRTRPRISARLILKPPDPLLEPLNRRRKLQKNLHARLPARVIDRLCLTTIHTAKIRRAQPQTLLWRPTTERLRNSG